MNRRIGILKQWLKFKSNVSFIDLISKVFDKTCTIKAKATIIEIKEDLDHIIVYLKDIAKPIYYPKSLPIHSLYQCISETYNPKDWHYYQVEETVVEKDDVVVDCGAAEGLFSLAVGTKCRKVYAVEPLPAFIKSMKKTFAQSVNVEVMPFALSDIPGKGMMNETDISSSLNSGGDLEVEMQTIDNLFFERGIEFSYLKADLEGYELNMLRGAEKSIKKYKPRIAITTYHISGHAYEIEKMLKNWNPDYRIRVKGIEDNWGDPVMLHAW